MHTTIVILAGLALLGLCLGVGHAFGGAVGTPRGALAFLPLWLLGSGINMYVGLRGGRTAAEEIPFLVVVFAIPAVVAFVVWWKARARRVSADRPFEHSLAVGARR